MTGWRMGWAIAPLHVTKAMATCKARRPALRPASASTRRSRTLAGDQGCVEAMRKNSKRAAT